MYIQKVLKSLFNLILPKKKEINYNISKKIDICSIDGNIGILKHKENKNMLKKIIYDKDEKGIILINEIIKKLIENIQKNLDIVEKRNYSIQKLKNDKYINQILRIKTNKNNKENIRILISTFMEREKLEKIRKELKKNQIKTISISIAY